MKIVSRYVLSELLQVFLVALSALTLFMLVVGLVKEAQQQGLGFMQIAALVPYVIPEAMRFAVPGTMLFAVASVFGRMSATNEITALKAAGISPMAAIWPAVGLAVAVSFVSVWLNDVAVSWGRDGVRRVIVSSVEEIIYGRLKQHRSYSAPQISINVKNVDGRKLIRPTLSYQPQEGAAVTVSAAEAELRAVGLGARMDHYPSQMSGGEQQRVALARAAAPRPAILLADEPTGNLDGANGAAIMDLLFGLRDRHGATLVLVTHAPELAARCDRVVRLADGLVLADERKAA